MNFYNSIVNSRKRVEVVERTAFLEDGLEFVHISEVYSPEHFYIQRAKFRPQLRSLEADMEKRDKIKWSVEEIRVGGVYLADCRDTDDRGTFRVKVHSILFVWDWLYKGRYKSFCSVSVCGYVSLCKFMVGQHFHIVPNLSYSVFIRGLLPPQIMSINQSSLNTDTQDEVFAYFLDYGFERQLSRDKIFEIPPEFVSVLPFQAIRCALHNVRDASQ